MGGRFTAAALLALLASPQAWAQRELDPDTPRARELAREADSCNAQPWTEGAWVRFRCVPSEGTPYQVRRKALEVEGAVVRVEVLSTQPDVERQVVAEPNGEAPFSVVRVTDGLLLPVGRKLVRCASVRRVHILHSSDPEQEPSTFVEQKVWVDEEGGVMRRESIYKVVPGSGPPKKVAQLQRLGPQVVVEDLGIRRTVRILGVDHDCWEEKRKHRRAWRCLDLPGGVARIEHLDDDGQPVLVEQVVDFNAGGEEQPEASPEPPPLPEASPEPEASPSPEPEASPADGAGS